MIFLHQKRVILKILILLLIPLDTLILVSDIFLPNVYLDPSYY